VNLSRSLLEGFWEALISRIFIPHNVKRCRRRKKRKDKERKNKLKKTEEGKLLFDFSHEV